MGRRLSLQLNIVTSFTHTSYTFLTAIMSLHYLPPVKPSAIALGTFFNHGVELAVLSPLFGQTYNRAKAANTKEEFVKSKEASSAAVAWGTTLVGSALQAYGVGALINATDTVGVSFAAKIFETVGLSMFMTWWGTRTNPFD